MSLLAGDSLSTLKDLCYKFKTKMNNICKIAKRSNYGNSFRKRRSANKPILRLDFRNAPFTIPPLERQYLMPISIGFVKRDLMCEARLMNTQMINAEDMTFTGKRIGISGAGIGGSAFALCLEQACKMRGINPMPIISIYERDTSPSDRENLGYSFSVMEGLHVCEMKHLTSHLTDWEMHAAKFEGHSILSKYSCERFCLTD